MGTTYPRHVVQKREIKMMIKYKIGLLFFLFCFIFELKAESLRVLIAGNLDISLENPGGSSLPLSYVSSAIITLGEDVRFFRGIELELTVPQTYLPHRGSLAIVLYQELSSVPAQGAADVEGRQVSFEPLPNKIQTIYQIPLRFPHNLKTSPYASVPTDPIPPSAFPIMVRLMPVIKGLSEEVESMVFYLHAKPILNDMGAVKIDLQYPPQLPGKPFAVLIDDVLVENPGEEQLLKEGEHHLVVLSEDYRNENLRFIVERGKIVDLTVELQDPTPLISFEAPEMARIYLDNQLVSGGLESHPVEPGVHEVKFQISDYAIIKSVNVQRGKTYRVAISVDINISELE
jgi:hypothetical protein